MLAPETLIPARLVTIAEPVDMATPDGRYVECAVCRDCFDDESLAYVIGEFPGAYLHTYCT